MKKSFIILMLLLSILCISGCKEDKSEWRVYDFEVEKEYDYVYRHRGYYELKDTLNYGLQNTVSAANVDGFGIIQTYAEYQTFVSKITNNNFKYDEDFFKDKSLIYISNTANDVLEIDGVRYSPYNINNCVYQNDVCYIALDYVLDFYSYYLEIGVNTKSIYTFAFDDTEKVSFRLSTKVERDPIASQAKVYSSSALNIEGEKLMVIQTIYNNSFEYIPDNIYQVSQVLNTKYQAFAIRKAFFEGGFNIEKLLSYDGTVLKSYYEYKTFNNVFDTVNNNSTYNREFFDENYVYVHITYGENYILDDSGFKYSYLELADIKYDENGVNINLVNKKNRDAGYCINVFLIAYDKTKGTNVSVNTSK